MNSLFFSHRLERERRLCGMAAQGAGPEMSDRNRQAENKEQADKKLSAGEAVDGRTLTQETLQRRLKFVETATKHAEQEHKAVTDAGSESAALDKKLAVGPQEGLRL